MLEDTVRGSLFDDTVLGRVRRFDIDVRTGVPLGRPGKLEYCFIKGLGCNTLRFIMEYELKYYQIFILYYQQGLVMGHLKYQLEEEHEQAEVRELYLCLA